MKGFTKQKGNAGGAYVLTFFAGMYALLRCAHTRKQHVCPAGDTIQRGAYIPTKGVMTYAPPAEKPRTLESRSALLALV